MSRRFAGFVLGLALLAAPVPALGQADDDATQMESGVPATNDGGWAAILGREHSRPHLLLGAWALHPFEPQFPELDWSQGFGFKTHQWLGATFLNSYGRRGFIAALERYWWVGEYGLIDVGIGYRAGVVTGYDEELFSLAGKTPVLPFTGLLLWTDLGPFSIDTFYAYRGITFETGLNFH